jgi:hypothetical protein
VITQHDGSGSLGVVLGQPQVVCRGVTAMRSQPLLGQAEQCERELVGGDAGSGHPGITWCRPRHRWVRPGPLSGSPQSLH